MINTIEEAQKHSVNIGRNFTHVVVLQDGSVHVDNDAELMQKIIDANECFVIKGGLSKKIKVSKQKEIKE